MQNIYDHIRVHGKVNADKLSGELSAETRAPLDARIDEAAAALHTAQGELSAVQATIAELTEAYNKAIEVINNLSERVTALEANYDPTIIK